jgi:peptidoglycan/LPS O-acetylase OafA/YrhL
MAKFFSAFSPLRNLRHLLFRPAVNYSVIDGFRALSMVMILMFHSYAVYSHFAPDITLPQMVEQGGYRWSWILNSDKSVDVFFVISGFLISMILMRQIDSLGRCITSRSGFISSSMAHILKMSGPIFCMCRILSTMTSRR